MKLTFANERIYPVYAIAIFFIAQLLYYLANAGFGSFADTDPFIVDQRLLQGHFWQSLFYYHIAPPLYVLYVALFKLYLPQNGKYGFYILHTLLGAYAVYSLYKVQRALNVNSVLAAFLTVTFALSPSFNLQEASAFYDFPTACLLTISTWHLTKLLNAPRFSTALTFFSTIALICSIRSLYHVLIYMAPVILVTMMVLKQHWKIILLGSLLPFLFVFSVYFKNYILFDAFTTSSYFGETLDSIVMQFQVNLHEREEGIKQGFFSGLALCPSSADTIATPTATSKYGGQYCYAVIAEPYRNAYIKQLGKDYKDIPILSCDSGAVTSTGLLLPHRNCLGNIGMSKEYQKNALRAILHYPGSYYRGIKTAWINYFKSTVRYYYSTGFNAKSLPVTLSKSWIQPGNTPCSIYLTFALPVLIFFSFCYLMYSSRAILIFLSLYLSSLFISLSVYTAIHINPSAVNLGVKSGAIVLILVILVVMLLIASLLRVGLSFMKPGAKIKGLIKPAAGYNNRMVVLYLLGNIVFTTLVLTLLTGISQQRYRFYIDGMYTVLLGLFIQTVIPPLGLKAVTYANKKISSV